MTVALSRALLAAVAALDGLKLRYAVVEGLAVGAWGVSQSTRDADLDAELPSHRRADLRRSLEAAGVDVPAMNEELQAYGPETAARPRLHQRVGRTPRREHRR